MKKFLIHLSLVMLASKIIPSVAWAIQVTPTYQLFAVQSGKKSEGECTVINNEGEKLTVTIYSKDWFVLPGNEKYKATQWLTFDEKKFVLKAGESKKVQFHVESPKGAQGELVGMMSMETAGELPSNVNKVLSVAIYNAVQGTEKMKGEIRAIMISPSSGTMNVSVLLKNKGNVHLRPFGNFEIQNEKGRTVANIFLTQGPPTYPEKEGVYMGEVKDFQIDPGLYKALITLTDVDRKVEILKTTKKFEVLENKTIELR